MRLAAIAREAWRNVRSGTARTVTIVCALILIVGGLVAADLASIRSIQSEARAFQTSGASVLIFSAPGQIDGAMCAALAGTGSVRTSGALRENETIEMAALPDSAVPAYEVTGGVATILGAAADSSGLVISDQLASMLGARPGDDVETAAGPVRVASEYAYPSDGRRSGFGYAALAPVLPRGAFDECWAEAWPTSESTAALLHDTLLASGDAGSGTYSQLNATHGSAFDGVARFRARLTAPAPAAAALLGAALGWIVVRARRLSHASALHAGVRHRDLVSIWAIEIGIAVPAVIVAASLITAGFVVRAPAEDAGSLIAAAAAIAGGAVSGVIAGGLAAYASIRERHLFRYFADR
ncbi:hypothetical protein [Microbacterium indicum]|uniref:hypothetical protein n=1 Tax=Microbacterium indicum TaxID=358100 RepID=UPI00040E408D|nr:hypothetical protein [Microbacterium indicum]